MNIFLSKKTLTILSLLTCLIEAKIIEIEHFCEILNYSDSADIMLTDIDNTLLEPIEPSQIGSDQWFTHLLHIKPNFQEALDFYCNTILTTVMKTVEPTLSETFQHLKQKVMVLGFTMRSIILAPCTVEQLEQNGILFPHILADKGFMIDGVHPIMLYHGIAFCQEQKNGLTLFALLDAYGITPRRIVMIDDKRSYLEFIEKACVEKSVEFIGLRYGYLDEKVKDFLTAHA